MEEMMEWKRVVGLEMPCGEGGEGGRLCCLKPSGVCVG
jgi:hypothetical protein